MVTPLPTRTALFECPGATASSQARTSKYPEPDDEGLPFLGASQAVRVIGHSKRQGDDWALRDRAESNRIVAYRLARMRGDPLTLITRAR